MGMTNYEELNNWAIEKIKEERFDEAFDELKRKEADGDADAAAVLAQFYFYGIGIAEDVERGLELMEKSVAMGSVGGTLVLATIYTDNDLGVTPDKVRAFQLYQKGAEGGSPECYAMLSECYMRGIGVEENDAECFRYTMLAAKAGNETGMFNAGICYDDGIGTNPDPVAASHWYKEYLNFEPEDDFAMLRIALCLADPYERYGIIPTGEMLNEAYFYASKALEKGNVEAHLIVGWFYEKGEVVTKDFDLAHKYIQLAADNGNTFAQKHLNDFRKNLYGNYYIPGM